MNFNNFYNKIENRLNDSVNSLWATGDATMQRYFTYLFQKDPLLAEPVFQNTFPWEPAAQKMGDLCNLFDSKFLTALDKVKKDDFRFPINRHPYRHQLESWKKLLVEKKSIAVTTGTGSGKTECFMLPVLQDIYDNCRHQQGINAIFLYPLNALIASQQKRINEWCKALGGINYAVYNGNTEDEVSASLANEALPLLLSRKQIRQTPPQILFTNPTMLEYILIRNKDTQLLKNSEGKLRWILLDEAHTLTGSSASEMALLIRRVIVAFKTDIKNIRFAITSATVGDGNDEHLKKFMSDLCGIEEGNISIIKGGRVLNAYDESPLSKLNIEKSIVNKLRVDLLAKNFLKLSDLKPYFLRHTEKNTLQWIDDLAEIQALPIRGHFFTRGIGGVYVCTNPECSIHGEDKPASALGTFHTVSAKNCGCGWPLLELVACRSCGNYMMEGEANVEAGLHRTITQISTVAQAAFDMDNEDELPDQNPSPVIANKVLIIRNRPNQRLAANNWVQAGFELDGKMNEKQTHLISQLGAEPHCPFCGEHSGNPIHFRISSAFTNRILSDIILEETPPVVDGHKSMLWQGRKYISFTDSRQGTARISALLNIDNEKNWIRAMVYHFLCQVAKSNIKEREDDVSTFPLEELKRQLLLAPNEFMKSLIQKQLDASIANAKDQGKTAKARLSWPRLYELIKLKSDLKILFDNNIGGNYNQQWKPFLEALFFDQFARRIPRERSLENLGLVNLIYPHFDKVQIPGIGKKLGLKIEEWRDLLKITMDYFVRANFNFQIPPDIWPYSNSFLRRSFITKDNWPQVNENSIIQNRLVLLICAGLGITEREDLTDEKTDEINELLDELWREISVNLLTNDNGTYQLDFYSKTEFELGDHLYLCPVKQRLIDKTFRGYSPWITGRLSDENIRHFKVKQEVSFPLFPYPFNLNSDNVIDHTQTQDWIAENSRKLREEGVWNNLHERVLDIKPLFLAGEHSAQQKDTRLKELEEKFENGRINVLNCSTTMEMGVDIGGISAVLMNNVPPGPANYLQRTGRAGRRSESKSLALTICAPNPIGSNAFNSPSWALAHKIAPPMLSFNSPEVVNRHINAFLLSKFIQSEDVQGINVKEKIEGFFMSENPLALQFSSWLMSLSNDDYRSEMQRIVKGTPLADKPNSAFIIKVRFNFEKTKNKVMGRISNFDDALIKLKNNYGDTSPEYRALNYQRSQFINKNALTYLAEEGFVPSAGIPTGVVDMDLTIASDFLNNKKPTKAKPSFHITRALADFAPGNQIVLDGWCYTSGGIITKNIYGDQARRDIIQSCRSCGFQRIVENTDENGLNSVCPHCGGNNFTGINFKNAHSGRYTELIEPVGFAVDIRDQRSRKISETSNYSFIEPLLMNIRPWLSDESSLIDIRESADHAEILYYNKGKGDGFAVCLNCGKTEFSEDRLVNHKRLRGGKKENSDTICEGNDNSFSIRKNVILGGRYQTDFCEIRIKDKKGNYSNDESLLYSLGVIFTKTLAEYLSIEAHELSFGIKQYDSYRTIFIFDTARGGAGYSSQFSFHLESVLKIAKEKLIDCDCQNACTKCLIDRNTNKQLHLLDRYPAIDWLNLALDQSIPAVIAAEMPGIRKIIGNVKDDISKQVFRNAIAEMWCYIDANVNTWDPESAIFINHVRNRIKLNFVLSQQPVYADQQDKITISTVQSWSSVLLDDFPSSSPLKKVAVIKLLDGSLYEYYAENFIMHFAESWGTVILGDSYRLQTTTLPRLFNIVSPTFGTPVKEVFLNIQNVINSNEIAVCVLNNLVAIDLDLKSAMNGKSFSVSYYDRYIKSPFASILLIQFLDTMRKTLNFEVENFTVYVKGYTEYSNQKYFFHNFGKSEERNEFIKSYAANNYDIPDVDVIEEKIPHFRYFEFKSDSLKIIIRPDAGVEHGWLANSPEKFEDSYDIDVIKIKRADTNPILYTISIEKV